VGGFVLPSRLCVCREGDKTTALTNLKKTIDSRPSLKAEAVKEAYFESLVDDPEFKKLRQ
jgi:hypothetical protein